MFAERALTKSVGSGAKQEEKDLCCSGSFSLPPHPHPAFPLKVHSWGGGGAGCVLQTKSWQPWPLSPLEPACVLLKARLFSLVPQTPTPVQVGPGGSGVGAEGSWVESLGKEKKAAKNRFSGTAAKTGAPKNAWACWGLPGTRAPAGRRRVDSGTRIQRGSRRRGLRGGEREVSVNHIN